MGTLSPFNYWRIEMGKKKQPIICTDWAGVPCTLVDETTGEPVCFGDKRDYMTVTGGSAPHKPSSTGRVYVREYASGYYPCVVKAKWVRVAA
jgi:hypothetical protein